MIVFNSAKWILFLSAINLFWPVAALEDSKRLGGNDKKEVVTHALHVESKFGDFDIELHGRRGQIEFIGSLAHILERDVSKLVEYFEFVPEDTVHIMLNESAIRANGSATVFPYNMITINPIPPLSQDALGENSDWLRGLLLHELVHVIHMDLTRGVLSGVRSIFGSFGKMGELFLVGSLKGLLFGPKVLLPHQVVCKVNLLITS